MAGGKPIGKESKRIIGAVCNDRRDQAAAPEIKDAEYQAKKPRGDDTLHALYVVSCSESYTPQYQPQSRSAKVETEACQNERALQLFLDAAGDKSRKDKQRQLLRRLYQFSERIFFEIVMRKVILENNRHKTVQEEENRDQRQAGCQV